MNRYTNDPRQVTAKYSSLCSRCKMKLQRGIPIYYWPLSKEVLCMSCGEEPFRQFLTSAADEEVYAGHGNPYAN